MTTPSIDDGNYDIQFSIRVPKALADEINARADREGIKPSTWIRNAITYTIKDKDQSAAEDIRTPLLRILQQDEAVRSTIREIVSAEQNPARPREDIRKELENASRERSKTEFRCRDIEHTISLLKSRADEQTNKVELLTAKQKKALTDFLQNPEDRELISELDKLAAQIAKEKGVMKNMQIQLSDEHLRHEQQKNLLIAADAQVTMLQEELTLSERIHQEIHHEDANGKHSVRRGR